MCTLDPRTIEKYADVLIKFALNGGQGVKPGEVVLAEVPDFGMPMLGALQRSILSAGAFPILRVIPTQFEREFLMTASDAQLKFFPTEYWRGVVKAIHHRAYIKPVDAPHAFEGVPPEKILARSGSMRPFRRWHNDKEAKGLLSWTLAFWGTEEYAAEAQMTLEEYWDQIINACYLNDPDPIQSWKQTFVEIERVRSKLQAMGIKRFHVTAEGTDLWITLGLRRAFRGGSGRNVPSYEIFVSPDARETHGRIAFSQPLFYGGVRIEGIWLVFEKGRVVDMHADTNEAVLRTMIAQPNADRLGEFSLTDTRFSRITRLMCNTLFDENMGGRFGNTHIALGMSYKDTFDGDPTTLKAPDWRALGFNDVNCAVHTDIISTSDRVVEVDLGGTSLKTIFRDGKFTI